MKITLARIVSASPQVVINKAIEWLQNEGTTGTPVSGINDDGSPFAKLDVEADGILMTTRFVAIPVDDGTRVEFMLRLQGLSLGARIRNLSLLPMKRMVTRESAVQFDTFLQSLDSSMDS